MAIHEVDDNGLPINPEMRRLEDEVCRLACEYRGAKTEDATNEAIEQYRNALKQLLNLGWGDYLDYECLLPDRYLPDEFLRLIEELDNKWANSSQS